MRNQTSFHTWQNFQRWNSSTFKMELFVTIGNGRNLQRTSSDGLTTNRQYLHVAVITQTSFQEKFKKYENGHAMKVAQIHFPVL